MGRALAGLVAFFILISQTARADARVDAKTPHWHERSAELEKVFSALMEDVSEDARFNSPKNTHRIEEDARKLSEFIGHPKGFKAESSSNVFDLSLPLISGYFRSEAQRAYQELKKGHREYSRSLLREVPNFCIGCHMRTGSGSIDSTHLVVKDPPANTKRIEKAEFLAATHQFDRALSELEGLISDSKKASAFQLEWERAVRFALAITVRVKNDPALTLSVIEKVIQCAGAPQFIKEDALIWKKSVEQWKAEAPRKSNSEEALFSEAKRLISDAYNLQRYRTDRASDILYLRASAATHELLRIVPGTVHMGEALFILGASYEAVHAQGLWSLQDLCYETCVRKVPHSEIAQACFRRFEESMFAGFSGSAGLSLPEDVKFRLTELKSLSEPAAPSTP